MEENKAISRDELIKENEELKEKLRNVYAEANKRLQEMNYSNVMARLNILFEILKNSTLYPEDFIKNVINEVVDTVTIPSGKDEEVAE